MEICHGQHDTMSFEERNQFGKQAYLELELLHKTSEKTPDRLWKWKFNPLSKEIPSERLEKPLEGKFETVYDLFERGQEFFQEIGAKHKGETILISTHAAWIKTMVDEAEYRERNDKSPFLSTTSPNP